MAPLRPGICRCPGGQIPGNYGAETTQTECANQCLADSNCEAYAFTSDDDFSKPTEMHDDSPNRCNIFVWDLTEDQVPSGWKYREAESGAENCEGELMDSSNRQGAEDIGSVCYIKFGNYNILNVMTMASDFLNIASSNLILLNIPYDTKFHFFSS